jgi:hypothetical protein
VSCYLFGYITCRRLVAFELFPSLTAPLLYLYARFCSRSQPARQDSYQSETPRRRQSTGLTLEQSYSSILTDDSLPSPLHARFDRTRAHMADQNQSQPLTGSATSNYGTLPASGSLGVNTNGRRTERGRRTRLTMNPSGPGFPRTSTRGSQYSPHEHSPLAIRRPISVAGLKETIKDSWRSTIRRTPSTYDPPLVDTRTGEVDDVEASRINGIRVWYSSFTSIDWLHDAVSNK